jgi:hypothetical protein
MTRWALRPTLRARLLIAIAVVATAPSALDLAAQGLPVPVTRRQFNDFFEYRGRWTLDEKASVGLPSSPEGIPAEAMRYLAALNVPRELVIATTETEFSVAKDGGEPEVYKIDGSETQERDPQTGVGLDRFYRFTQVADSVALTRRLRTGTPVEPGAELITDAYSVAGAVLTVERLRSHVFPPGSVAVLKEPGSHRMTLVYRRQAPR